MTPWKMSQILFAIANAAKKNGDKEKDAHYREWARRARKAHVPPRKREFKAKEW